MNLFIGGGLILDRYIDQDLFGLVYGKPEHFDNPALESYLPEGFQALKNSPSFRNIIAKFVLLYTTTTGNEVTTIGDEIAARSTNGAWSLLASSMRPNPLNRHYLSHALFREERINSPFAPEKSLFEELENRDFSILLGANLISASPTIRLRYDSDDYHIVRVLNPLPVHVYERSPLRVLFSLAYGFIDSRIRYMTVWTPII